MNILFRVVAIAISVVGFYYICDFSLEMSMIITLLAAIVGLLLAKEEE